MPDPYAGRIALGPTVAEGAPTPVFVEFLRNGEPLAGRYLPMPGFFVRGPWEKELAPGRWQVRISRGPYFKPLVREIDLVSGTTSRLGQVELVRSIDLRKEGWYGGDADGDVYHGERIFTDVGAETAATISRAVGLDWVGAGRWGTEPGSWGDAEAVSRSLSSPDLFFFWTDEQPHSQTGHICLVGIQRPRTEPFDQFWTRTQPLLNYEELLAVRASGAATFANHPLRWWLSGGKFVTNLYSGLPFDLCAAGLVDGLNLNEGGENVLKLWSMLLDRGYRVAATAGADFCLDRPNGPLPGMARLYVHCPQGLSQSALAEGIRAGRTVVSTGPLLQADLDGKAPGATVKTGASYRIRVRSWARRDREEATLSRIELWAHGRAQQTIHLDQGKREAEVTLDWRPEGRWDWAAIRVVASDGWAMTSPFYAADPEWKAPVPVRSRVHLQVTGIPAAELGKAALEVWDNWPEAPGAARLSREPLKTQVELEAPVTATLVIRLADGREKRIRLYEASRAKDAIEAIASGQEREQPLLRWETYEEVLRRCRNINLTVDLAVTALSSGVAPRQQ
jgi:hypothetical protein